MEIASIHRSAICCLQIIWGSFLVSAPGLNSLENWIQTALSPKEQREVGASLCEGFLLLAHISHSCQEGWGREGNVSARCYCKKMPCWETHNQREVWVLTLVVG